MLILGIDPGTATTGYALIRTDEEDYEFGSFKSLGESTMKFKRSLFDKDMCMVDYGLIETERNGYSPDRYAKIYELIEFILKKRKPDVMAIEKIFFANNARTAINVGQAQGVMFLAASHNKVPVVEYAPPTIKKVITGNGRAKKKEVEVSVREILGSREGAKVRINKQRRITKTHIDNAIDAIAISLCHAFHLYDDTLKKHREVMTNGKF